MVNCTTKEFITMKGLLVLYDHKHPEYCNLNYFDVDLASPCGFYVWTWLKIAEASGLFYQ